jgi:ArsR family transcriptional regulator
MSSKNILTEMETFFMALADKTRLRLLNLMREDEVCVCFFTEVLDDNQPKISRHLAYLRNAGLVESRREGKWMLYRILIPEDPDHRKVLQDTLNWLAEQEEMQKDYVNLAKVCCSPNAPVTIARAPKPETILEANVLEEKEMELEKEEMMETFLL